MTITTFRKLFVEEMKDWDGQEMRKHSLVLPDSIWMSKTFLTSG